MKGGLFGALLGFTKLLVGVAFILVLTVGVSSTVTVYQHGGTALGQAIVASVGFVKNMAAGFSSTEIPSGGGGGGGSW